MSKRTRTGDAFLSLGEEDSCRPPVELDGRSFCGDLDIRIDAHGQWHYNQSPIRRKEMVCLFASMLALDCRGRHWLVTPTELGRIEVEDAPFVAVDMFTCGEGEAQAISFYTNVDRLVTVGPATPLAMCTSSATGEPAPYVTDERGLRVKVGRAVYYDLVEHGVMCQHGGCPAFGVWSSGVFFPLGQIPAAQA